MAKCERKISLRIKGQDERIIPTKSDSLKQFQCEGVGLNQPAYGRLHRQAVVKAVIKIPGL